MAVKNLGRVRGLSAYEVAQKNGYSGSESEWLQSLKGANGSSGNDGQKGDKGERGEKGYSPSIREKTNTSSSYVLTITNEDGSFDTPNLKGRDGSGGSGGGLDVRDGEDGFFPTITEKTNISSSYVLTVTNKNGSFDTPNLKGRDGSDGQNGRDGNDGTDGYSPTITEKTNTDDEYVLTVRNKTGSFDTPNLKGASGSERTYEKFVVVGVWGQSNAVGYDESNLTLYDVSKDERRILQWGFGDNELTPLGYCAKNHQNMNSSGVLRGGQQSVMANNRQGEPLNDPERFTNAKTKGIHLPLANLIVDEIPSDYGLIIVPAAYGGQSITTFLSGSRIDTFAQNIKRALDTHANSVLAGIIWCQGENDSGSMNKDTYKGNFETLINNLKSKLSGYEKQSITGAVDASIWYNYEYPVRFKDNTYGRPILEAQKEVLGDRYTPIPDEVPVNLTQYCASNKPDHYAQDAFRTHIAPRVFEVMKKNGAFLSVGLPVVAPSDSGGSVNVDEIKEELSNSFITTEQSAHYASKNDLMLMVGELQSYHLWYEERIAQLEEAVKNGSRDIQTILRMFDVTNDMLDVEGEWNTDDGMIEYVGPRGGKPRSLLINTEDYDTIHFHNNVNAAWGLIVAYNEESGKYLWLYSDNHNVFMTDRTPSVSTAFTQQTNNTGSGTRNIIKQNTNLMIKRNGTVITGENTGGTTFSIDIAANLAVLGNAESTKMYWGFAIAWSQTINKFDNSLPYWMDVKLSNQQG